MSKGSITKWAVGLTVVIASIAVFHYWVAPWARNYAATQAAYNAAHHDVCTDVQTITTESPELGSFGHQEGYTLYGDKGGTKITYNFPPPGLGVQYCFGTYVSEPNR